MAANVLLAGKIENPDGEWLVGDALYQTHPGRIEPDDPRRLLFKVWTAGGDSPKYIRTPKYRGWRPPLPAHDGRMEKVQVFTGMLACEKNPDVHYLNPGGAIELGPEDCRCWFLSPGSMSASGVTICRRYGAAEGRNEFGEGPWYEYYSFIRPVAFPEWYQDYVPRSVQKKLIVVFEGEIRTDDVDGGLMPELRELEYMFMKKNERVRWRICEPHTSFAILYF
ncbi:MAG: hypothetical protein HY221_00010 [Candidatus Sungbacteria bacterium]|uniref:Uncharacterized protein n=1 Tax=Candidatus Sungiibacteriota bacterium TaxID=2750080 RepID=A0A932R1G1_9BACT|nr:hypothetical protein [Candidatus Sungbacteria bacterium]